MSIINYAQKEISFKIVYYGTGVAGKTANLQYIYRGLPDVNRGNMVSLATGDDRTLFFDFLPVSAVTVRNFVAKFQLYTVPGQIYYNMTRKLVLRGVDGIVFVADSQWDRLPENVESFRNLEENLKEYGYNLEEIPYVIQYNKRDLPNAAPIAELQSALNPGWPVADHGKQKVTPDPYHDSEFLVNQEDGQWIERAPYFEAVALTGEGVFDTLKAISKNVVKTLG